MVAEGSGNKRGRDEREYMKRTSAFWEFDIVGVETGKSAGEMGEYCVGFLHLNPILWARGSPSW